MRLWAISDLHVGHRKNREALLTLPSFGDDWLILGGDMGETEAHLDFTLGADNITNTYPTETLYLNNTNGQIPYSSLSPFGFNGAYVYGKVAYRW